MYKLLAKKMLIRSGVVKLAGKLKCPGVVILRYHSVQDEPELFEHSIGSGIIHATSTFQEQMEIITRYFDPVTLDDVLLFVKGEKTISRRPVAVTFDDGFADNFEIAASVLDHFGIRASFYVTVDSIEARNAPWYCRLRHAFKVTQKQEWLDIEGGHVWKLQNQEESNAAFIKACERCGCKAGHDQEETVKTIEHSLDVEPFAPRDSLMMSWDQIRKLHQAGHTIGSHTLTHPNLAYIDKEDLCRELVESKKRIEKELGTKVIHFSYPSPILEPHWNEQSVTSTMQAGYHTAVTCIAGPVLSGDNPLLLKRIAVPKDRNEFLWDVTRTLLRRCM